MSEINFFSQPDSEENLPPAGHERTEELKKRTDRLEEQAEEKYADVGSMPKAMLEPDHNIQSDIRKSYLDIGTDHPLYVTKWVNYVNQNGMMVWQAKADGWMVATAKEFPEAADMQKSDGTVRVGDVLLMFIRKDDHFRLQQREATKRLRQQYGVEADIHALAEATNRREGKEVFAKVETPAVTGGVSGKTLETLQQRATMHKAAVNTAARHVGNLMKKGPIPGVPIK